MYQKSFKKNHEILSSFQNHRSIAVDKEWSIMCNKMSDYNHENAKQLMKIENEENQKLRSIHQNHVKMSY
jgi:hypothetical protein